MYIESNFISSTPRRSRANCKSEASHWKEYKTECTLLFIYYANTDVKYRTKWNLLLLLHRTIDPDHDRDRAQP